MVRLAALAALAALAPAPASASPGGCGSDLDLLYSSQFAFTRGGLPIHRIRVREGLDSVRIEGAGLTLRAGGPEGPEVRGGQAFVVRAVETRRARVRYWIAAERRAPGDARGAAEAAARLRGRAPETRIFEVGTLFAVEGKAVDGRRLAVALGPWDRADAARAAARALGMLPDLHVELVEPASGTLEASDGGAVVRAADLLWFKPGGGPLRVADGRGGATYPGDVYVAVDREGKLAVVNAVDEDELLAGLLPAEMPPSAPMAALEAQAIAARTELLVKIGERHLADPYRLCAEAHCQVYRGSERRHPRATEAVRATRGHVLLGADGRLVEALWSASCGGHTEDNDRAWPGAPVAALRGRPDGEGAPSGDEAALRRLLAQPARGFCGESASARWTQRLEPGAGERLGVGALRELAVLERGVSGRATAVRLVGERGAREVHGELAIREALGGARSSLFVVERDAGAIVLRGAGHGHGVGLCQAGAIGRARAGHDYRRILEHYYAGAHPVRLY